MIKPQNQILTHIDEHKAAPVERGEGWHDMDIRWVLGKHSGTANLTLFRVVFKPGAKHAKHVHANADEVYYLIRGRAAAGVGDEEHEIGPGTVHYVPKGGVHWLRNLDPEGEVEAVGLYLGVGSLEESGYTYLGDV